MSGSAVNTDASGADDAARDRAWLARISCGDDEGAIALEALYKCYRTRLRDKLRSQGVAKSDCNDVLSTFLRLELFTGKVIYKPPAPPFAWLLVCMENRAKAWHVKQGRDSLAHAHPLADLDKVHEGHAESAGSDDLVADSGPGTLPPSDHFDPTFEAVARRQRLAQLQQDIARAHAKGGKWAAAIELVKLVQRNGWNKADVARYLFELCYTICEKHPCSQALCEKGTQQAAENALRNARNLLQPYFNRRDSGSSPGGAVKGG